MNFIASPRIPDEKPKYSTRQISRRRWRPEGEYGRFPIIGVWGESQYSCGHKSRLFSGRSLCATRVWEAVIGPDHTDRRYPQQLKDAGSPLLCETFSPPGSHTQCILNSTEYGPPNRALSTF